MESSPAPPPQHKHTQQRKQQQKQEVRAERSDLTGSVSVLGQCPLVTAEDMGTHLRLFGDFSMRELPIIFLSDTIFCLCFWWCAPPRALLLGSPHPGRETSWVGLLSSMRPFLAIRDISPSCQLPTLSWKFPLLPWPSGTHWCLYQSLAFIRLYVLWTLGACGKVSMEAEHAPFWSESVGEED